MKNSVYILILLVICTHTNAQIIVEQVGSLPEAVANNAVCEGVIGDTNFIYSFGGLDESKIPSGIHLKCFRYNVETGISERIEDLPDDQGKVAAWASRIGDIIYIAGGYHVASNGSEDSSDKMHRFDILNNTFLEDGQNIPRSIDDQVQAVWRDSLIYLITGWSNNENVPDVQIYDPSSDSWQSGTFVPNNHTYKSFGASGSIIGDTIYYFGGASSTDDFAIQNTIRKGVINPADPTEIEWSLIDTDETQVGYRMAATNRNNKLYWIGGSEETYNYNGIAYNSSVGVAPSNKILELDIDTLQWNEFIFDEVPMDLRGLAEVSNDVKYIAGGMSIDQTVTDKIFKITFDDDITASSELNLAEKIKLFPNPCSSKIYLEYEFDDYTSVNIYTAEGVKVSEQKIKASRSEIDVSNLANGVYFLSFTMKEKNIKSLFLKLDH